MSMLIDQYNLRLRTIRYLLYLYIYILCIIYFIF